MKNVTLLAFLQANRHTIILMQTAQNRSTRTFMDFESVSQAMDGMAKLLQLYLCHLMPMQKIFLFGEEHTLN